MLRSRALVGAIVLALSGPGGATASFPGRDGPIAFFVNGGCSRYAGPDDPCVQQGFTAIMAASPAGASSRDVVRCPGPTCVPGVAQGFAYSPDGRRLALEALTADVTQVAIVGSDGSAPLRLTVPGNQSFPLSWLPAGRQIGVFAYGARADSPGRVFVIDAGGGAVHAAGGPRGTRAWSATGAIAVAHPRGIYAWRPGERRRLILRNGDRVSYASPDWSPDGRRLVLVRSDLATGLNAIVTVAADGRDRRVVVRAPFTWCGLGAPVWSPSGRRIAFATACLDDRGDVRSVYTVRTDGKGLRMIVDPDRLGSDQLVMYVGSRLSWPPRVAP
jgi:Tol biopolymer transport system component